MIEREYISPVTLEKHSNQSISIIVLISFMNVVKEVLLANNCHNNISNPFINPRVELVIRFDFFLHEAVTLDRIVWKIFFTYYEKLDVPFDQLQSVAVRSMEEILYAMNEEEKKEVE